MTSSTIFIMLVFLEDLGLRLILSIRGIVKHNLIIIPMFLIGFILVFFNRQFIVFRVYRIDFFNPRRWL